jgi:GNAT superfamily N-acetyltransferase
LTAIPAPILDFTIRPSTEDDRRFIVETTAKVRLPHDVPWTDWKRGGLQDAHSTFQTGVSRVAEAEGVLVGFALYDEANALSMLYVKREFRGVGIGLSLLGPLPDILQVTKATPSWRQWCRTRGIRWAERTR